MNDVFTEGKSPQNDEEQTKRGSPIRIAHQTEG
jgi:hypothetical protein